MEINLLSCFYFTFWAFNRPEKPRNIVDILDNESSGGNMEIDENEMETILGQCYFELYELMNL